MATNNSTSQSKPLTDSSVDALQPRYSEKHQDFVVYTVADPGCTGLHVRIEKSGLKSWWLNVWTPEGAPKRQRYAWKLGEVSTFRLYKKRQATEEARQQSIRDYAEIIRAKSLITDLREAKRAAVAKNDSYKSETLQGFIDHVYADHYASKNKRADEMMKWLKSSFADLMPMKLEKITHLTIRSWMKKQEKKQPSPATIARKLQLLSGCLTYAVVKKQITSHPLQAAERVENHIPISEVDNQRKRYLLADEEVRLRTALDDRDREMKAARLRNITHKQERHQTPPQAITGAYGDHLTPLVLFALNTGVRRGGLFGLRWEHIKDGQVFISKELDKAGNGYSVPLSIEAIEVLRKWKHQTTDKGLIFTYQGHGIKSIKTSWGSLMSDAKVTDFRFHDLRHSFASKLVIGGVDFYRVSKLMGHSSIDMTKRYAHLAPDHMQDALEVLNS